MTISSPHGVTIAVGIEAIPDIQGIDCWTSGTALPVIPASKIGIFRSAATNNAVAVASAASDLIIAVTSLPTNSLSKSTTILFLFDCERTSRP